MSRVAVNTLLIIALIVVNALTFTLRRDYTRRNVEFLPDMAASQAYNAQSANPNFPDGKTSQPPPYGAIAKGFPPFHYLPTPEDAMRAGGELQNPIPDTDYASVARGEAVFSRMCQPCHGAGGNGDGVVTQRGFPPPPSFFAERAMKLRDGQMFHIITFGQRNMPSLSPQVSREDRWKVIKYLRSLQVKRTPKAVGG